MEKQEAIDFVIREIEKNRSEDEVVEELSGLLGVPQDIVKRFVSRILASRSMIEPIILAGEAAEEVTETQLLPPETNASSGGEVPGEKIPAPQRVNVGGSHEGKRDVYLCEKRSRVGASQTSYG